MKCINCSYKNIVRSFLDKIVIFVCAGKYTYTLELLQNFGESLIVIIIKLFANFVFELACLQLRCRCMYRIVKRLTRFKLPAKKTCLWRFHKGHNQGRCKGQRRSSMPIFEIQLVCLCVCIKDT